MSITVTIEELQSYQQKLGAWYANGNAAYIGVIARAFGDQSWPAMHDVKSVMAKANKARDEFEEINAKPKLIPSI